MVERWPLTRAKRLTLLAAILGSSVVFLDGTVVNVALPAIREDLDAGLAEQQWVVEAYLLTLGSLILVGGSLGDILGRRRVFVWGLVGFGLTSALCAIAPSDVLLIVARALQGIAGALLVPSSLALITAVFPGDERGAAIGSWTAWTGISFVLGPLGGGALIEFVSWRWIFAINVPFVLATLLLVRAGVPESRDEEAPQRIDYLGALLVVARARRPGVRADRAADLRLERPAGVRAAGRRAGLLALFVWHERRTDHPMLPLGLFRSRNFAIGNLATLLIYGGLGAATFFVTIFLQQVAGYSPIAAGLSLVPITLCMWTLSRRFGALSDRIGPRLLMGRPDRGWVGPGVDGPPGRRRELRDRPAAGRAGVRARPVGDRGPAHQHGARRRPAAQRRRGERGQQPVRAGCGAARDRRRRRGGGRDLPVGAGPR